MKAKEKERQQKEQISLSVVQCWMYDSYCFNQSQFNRQQPRENLWGVMKADRWKLTAIIKDCASTQSLQTWGINAKIWWFSYSYGPQHGNRAKNGGTYRWNYSKSNRFVIVNMYPCKTQDGSSIRTHTWGHVGAGLTALFSIFSLRKPGEQLLGWIRVSRSSCFLFPQIIHYESNGWVNIWSNHYHHFYCSMAMLLIATVP